MPDEAGESRWYRAESRSLDLEAWIRREIMNLVNWMQCFVWKGNLSLSKDESSVAFVDDVKSNKD